MTAVSEVDYRGLERAVTGTVLRPGSAGYPASAAPFNRRYPGTTADAVVRVADAADVVGAVDWARDNGVPVVPRNGGHSYGGYSAGPGLVLDLSALDTVTADGTTGLVTVGGGASTGQAYAAMQPHRMAIPLGNGNTVGVAGLALGGGSAAVSRKFGLTADTLVATTIVTADGVVRHCDARTEPDLFWACRGGGGGHFGVNLTMTFQAHPVNTAATCLLLWDRAHAAPVFAALQQVMLDAPDALSTRLGLATTGDTAVVSVVGMHLGPASELREILAAVLAAAPPLRADIADRTFWEAKDYLAHETSAGAFAVRTSFLAHPLSADAVATALSCVDSWPGGHNPDGGGIALFAWGGAINRVAPDATAFVHREAVSLLAIDTSWADATRPDADPPEVIAAHHRWLAEFRDALAPHTTPRSYQNFIDPDLPDPTTAHYGRNAPRLQAIKHRVDPTNLFAHPQTLLRTE